MRWRRAVLIMGGRSSIPRRSEPWFWMGWGAKGLFQVALVDFRLGSPTFGKRNTMYVGPLRPWQILVPPGVGHGYKVIGEESAMLIYMTDRFYDPSDEGRVVFDDPGIHYDWETQHK